MTFYYVDSQCQTETAKHLHRSIVDLMNKHGTNVWLLVNDPGLSQSLCQALNWREEDCNSVLNYVGLQAGAPNYES